MCLILGIFPFELKSRWIHGSASKFVLFQEKLLDQAFFWNLGYFKRFLRERNFSLTVRFFCCSDSRLLSWLPNLRKSHSCILLGWTKGNAIAMRKRKSCLRLVINLIKSMLLTINNHTKSGIKEFDIYWPWWTICFELNLSNNCLAFYGIEIASKLKRYSFILVI